MISNRVLVATHVQSWTLRPPDHQSNTDVMDLFVEYYQHPPRWWIERGEEVEKKKNEKHLQTIHYSNRPTERDDDNYWASSWGNVSISSDYSTRTFDTILRTVLHNASHQISSDYSTYRRIEYVSTYCASPCVTRSPEKNFLSPD